MEEQSAAETSEPALVESVVMSSHPEIILQGQDEEIQIIVPDPPGDDKKGADSAQDQPDVSEAAHVYEATESSGKESQLATVQLGNLSCNSVQELAEHLPNIGIHFICKKCDIVCSQMSELLEHLANGKCNLDSPEEKKDEPAPASAPSSAAKRKRGRPRKQENQPREPLPVRKETDYEELPRLAAEPETLARSNRRTRYSMGKIKRLDVLTLLGGRVKEEPVEEGDDDEFKPDSSKKGLKEQAEQEKEDNDLSEEDEWSPRKRTKKENNEVDEKVGEGEEQAEEEEDLKAEKQEQETNGEEMMEVVGDDQAMKLKPVPSHPKVSFRKEGSANLIVLDTGGKPDTDPDIISFVEDALGGATQDESTAKDSSPNEASEEKEVNDKENCEEEEKEEGVGEQEEEKEEEEQECDGLTNTKVVRATQGVNYMGLTRHRGGKKRYYKCTICKQRFFHTREELLVHHECHRNKKVEEELYGCPLEVCAYSTKSWNRMLDHLCRHDEYKEKFKNHTFVKNILGDFTCPICKKKFERKNNMKGHLAKVHFKQSRTCGVCNKIFEGVDEKTFKRHVEKCQNLLFQCSHCEYKTPVSANMRKHMKIHLGQGYSCDICQSVFPSRQRLLVHKQTHESNRKQFQCDQCETVFLSLDALKKHVIRFHTETSTIYACSDCNFKTKIQSDLKKHFVHVHDKKFKCEHCPYQTNSSAAYEQHQEYHSAGRSFGCTFENCYYRGATPKQLANHVGQVHKYTKKYQCPICHRFYKKKAHLARHLVSHTEDKPYACLECGLEFNNHSSYYRHRNKTGHDAKREGIVSVPQNITIHYVNHEGEGIAQEGIDDQRVLQPVEGEQTYQMITQGENGEYIATTNTTTENSASEDSGKKENLLMLETEDGEPVTYVLRMSENENGETTIESEDGVAMDASVVQQIQEQLQLLQQGGFSGETEGSAEVVVAAAQQEDGQPVTLHGNIESVMDGDVVMESQVVYSTQEEEEEGEEEEVVGLVVQEGVDTDTTQVEIVGVEEKDVAVEEEEEATLVIGDETNVTHQEVYAEVTPEFQQAVEQGEDMAVEESLVVQDQSSTDIVNEWVVEQVEEVSGAENTPVAHFLTEQQIGQEDEQRVMYEESVVEVGNPRGEDGDGKKQYAIVLLPSNAASGDEPEAALSMLQLQSGSTITMGDNVEYVVQESEQQ